MSNGRYKADEEVIKKKEKGKIYAGGLDRLKMREEGMCKIRYCETEMYRINNAGTRKIRAKDTIKYKKEKITRRQAQSYIFCNIEGDYSASILQCSIVHIISVCLYATNFMPPFRDGCVYVF
jgi:hypothetical protein